VRSVVLRREGELRWVGLNRPGRRNAQDVPWSLKRLAQLVGLATAGHAVRWVHLDATSALAAGLVES
jgi:enoyl-CoA hydratase/carnithine racemase